MYIKKKLTAFVQPHHPASQATTTKLKTRAYLLKFAFYIRNLLTLPLFGNTLLYGFMGINIAFEKERT